MPLPIPKGKDQDTFISSCMSNKTMLKEFPDQKQRAAVCYSQWKRKSVKKQLVQKSLQLVNLLIKRLTIGYGNKK